METTITITIKVKSVENNVKPIIVDGHKIQFVDEDAHNAYIMLDGQPLVIDKKPYNMPISESRYIGYKDEECYLGMIIKDGVAESTEVNCDTCPVFNGLKFRMTFPTIKEIFTDAKKFEAAIAYARDLGENPFEETKYWNLYYFWEGFFFFGEYTKFLVDKGNGNYDEFKY